MSGELHWLDFVILGIFLCVSASIGVIFAIRAKLKLKNNVVDFNVGSRELGVIPVAVSTIVSLLSATAMLGMPVEAYTGGVEYVWLLVSAALGALVATLLFIPLLYPLRLTSSQEYLELRFKSRAAKLTGTLLITVYTVLYTSVTIYSPASALETITGLPIWICLLMVGLVSCLTALGGIRAVVWTDVLQFTMMLSAILGISIQACLKVGGIDVVWRMNAEAGRTHFFDLDPDPTTRHTFWTLLFAGSMNFLTYHSVHQMAVQRYSSVRTLNGARIVVLLNMPLWIMFGVVLCLAGMSVFAYYASIGCDPIAGKKLKSINQLMPYFVSDVMNYPGFVGFYLASLLSGSLSSVTSAQSSLSAVIWEDLLKQRFGHLPEWKKIVISRVNILIFSAITVSLAFLASFVGGTVVQLAVSVVGATGGPILGMFVLGGMFPWANWIGAVSGGLSGLTMALWVAFGAFVHMSGGRDFLPTNTSMCALDPGQFNLTSELTTVRAEVLSTVSTTTETTFQSSIHQLYKLSYLWYTAVGLVTAVVVGLIVSFATGRTNPRDVDPKYLLPFFDRICCCFPKSCRHKLHCGVDYESTKYQERKVQENGIAVLQPTDSTLQLQEYFPRPDGR